MRKVSGNSEEKWWVALCKIQKSQASYIFTLLKKKPSFPELSCTSPLVLLIPWKHFCATHHSPDRGRVSIAHLLQKLLLPLAWVKLGRLTLVCNNAVSISFLSKAQKSYDWIGSILEFNLGFDSKVNLDPVLWVLMGFKNMNHVLSTAIESRDLTVTAGAEGSVCAPKLVQNHLPGTMSFACHVLVLSGILAGRKTPITKGTHIAGV